MEQLKELLISEIKKEFDLYLDDHDEERCNYLIFDDLEEFKDFYDNFVEEYFNEGEDSPLERRDYNFSWFDGFKIIKEYVTEIDIPFDDYDEENKSWNMLCYACARQSDIYELDEYKIWYKTPKQNFTHMCHKQLEYFDRQTFNDGPQKVEYNAIKKFYKSLIEFDIEKATQNLNIINLVFQKYMRQYEKEKDEGEYIKICNSYMGKYKTHLHFKEQAIKLKDL